MINKTLTLSEEFIHFFERCFLPGVAIIDQYPFMDSPMVALSVMMCYLVVVFTGPGLMRNHKAYRLKILLRIYNITLTMLSALIVFLIIYGLLRSGFDTCYLGDYMEHPMAQVVILAAYLFFLSKMVETADTVFFILRKKNSQLSFLHVYHHCSMIAISWLGLKLNAGGQGVMIVFLNSFVHVIMYTYYALSTYGPNVRKYLWWKTYLTQIQLLQFVIMFTHTIVGISIKCDFPLWSTLVALFYLPSMIALFFDFYFDAYVAPKRRAKEAQKKAQMVANGNGYTAVSNGNSHKTNAAKEVEMQPLTQIVVFNSDINPVDSMDS